ncbi:sulfite exporter TauE/SafE family protein [Blastopirellula marina]|uniref:Probable membrane transporter protein n=1 Tax=Blastopirellula marina TaxID=124 RepID=A0A2S8F702_9BACT|nr:MULTISPECIES: sulfite exporter TauE/SafE family protein [Pirellulaceae]PQO27937.1 sulfite exporter TauE/SafE family protein [Blastopirellula marina]RCS48362.1 sulfite exporter TauE/SafE family protein [Bremerella cremea]
MLGFPTDFTWPRIWPFIVWLTVFYSIWLTVVILGGYWPTVLSHWPIALTMSVGSYVAGSTPMGGGTVAFPVLVLLFDLPGSLGRNFGLAIQSIGMTSATIYILSTHRPVDWRLLSPALWGALIGTPLGATLVAPYVPDLWVKLIFGVIWASFGILHLVKIRELTSNHGTADHASPYDFSIGIAIGLMGGVASSITGVGIDMMIYATLVLLYRADLKTAIPTSVILMAFTSLVGIGSNIALSQIRPDIYAIDQQVFANWLAAAPIVALGAPFGAIVVNLISRTPTLIVVSLLCIGQFIWTLIHEHVTGMALIGALAGVVLFNAMFHGLYYLGKGESPFLLAEPVELANEDGDG